MKKNMYIFSLLLSILFCHKGIALEPQEEAEELSERESIFNTIRASGMGGANISIPVGIESLLYNPAGLSSKISKREKSLSFTLNLDTYFKPQYLLPILKNISKNSLTSEALINAKNLITTSGAGSAFAFCFGFTPLKRNFGFGIYGGATVYLTGKPFPLGTQGYINIGINFPMAYSWVLSQSQKDKLSFGVSFHPEVAIFRTLNGTDVDGLAGGTLTIKQLISEVVENPYVCLPMDLGIIYSSFNLPYEDAEMRISFVTKNIFGNYLGTGKKIERVKKEFMLNSGVAILLPFNIYKIKCLGIISAEIRGMNLVANEEISFFKSLRLGAELDIGQIVFFRVGLSSGYPAFGLEIRLLNIYFGFSWQTLEEGLYIGDNPLSICRFSVSFR